MKKCSVSYPEIISQNFSIPLVRRLTKKRSKGSAGEGETSGRERGIYESPAELWGVFFSGGCWVSEGEGLSSTGTGMPGPLPSPPEPGGST